MAPEPRPAGLAVHRRFTFRTAGQLLSCLILLFASAGFVTGGAARPASAGGIVFLLLGAVGIASFATALLMILAQLLGRRPVLVLDDEGVRLPAALPWLRRAGRTGRASRTSSTSRPGRTSRPGELLPWAEVAALCIGEHGAGGGKGSRPFVSFLPSETTAAAVRTATKAQLIALTLPDVPLMADAVPWTLTADSSWTASVKDIAAEARRHGVAIIDRRTK